MHTSTLRVVIIVPKLLLPLCLIFMMVGCVRDSAEPAPPAKEEANTETETEEPAVDSNDAFQTLLGKSNKEVQAKIDAAWEHFFYGDDETERVYYPVEDGMGYITDVNNDDVRSEGISYGMMIAVQMDKQEEFDRIWKYGFAYG